MNKPQKSALQKQYDAILDRLDAAIQKRLRLLPEESDTPAGGQPEIPVFLWIMLAMIMLAFALIIAYDISMMFVNGCIPPLCPPCI